MRWETLPTIVTALGCGTFICALGVTLALARARCVPSGSHGRGNFVVVFHRHVTFGIRFCTVVLFFVFRTQSVLAARTSRKRWQSTVIVCACSWWVGRVQENDCGLLAGEAAERYCSGRSTSTCWINHEKPHSALLITGRSSTGWCLGLQIVGP